MKLLDIISLSTRTFRMRSMRAWLTVLGVGVGIGAVLFLVSLGYGLQRVILNEITTADSLLSLDVNSGSSGLLELKKENVEKMRLIENVEEVSPIINLPGQISLGEVTSDVLTYGVDKSIFRLSGIIPSFGDEFESSDSKEVVVSSIVAQLFNFKNVEEIIGQEINISLFITKIIEGDNEGGVEEVELIELKDNFKVVGVINDENVSFVYLPINALANLNIDTYEQVKVKVVDEAYMEDVRENIINQGFLVSSLSDTIAQAKSIFKIIQIILGLFGLIALIVSAIGMFNTMTITLLERTNEIGIMRAIGSTKKNIRILFLFESMIIGFLGGLIGVLIGFLTGEIVNFVLNLLAKNFGGQVVNLFYYQPWFICFIIIFSTVIGFITGLYPSRRAGKLNPLDALRYK